MFVIMNIIENKIIRLFHFEQLNLILGGIKERTIYRFYLSINDTHNQDESLQLIKDVELSCKDLAEISKTMIKKLSLLFGVPEKDEKLFVLNYLEVAKDAHRYFRKNKVELEKIYLPDDDLYKFLEYMNDIPLVNEINEIIKGISFKGGSIIIFNTIGTDGINELFIPETPKGWNEIDITVNTGSNLFDYFCIAKDDRHRTSFYPFDSLKDKDINRIFSSGKVMLYKDVDFDVEPNDESPEMINNIITHHYTFTRRYDILGEEFKQRHKQDIS